MREITTVCARDCYDTCALRARLNDNGRIVSVRGDRSNPITAGFVCPRGAGDARRVSTNRIQVPLERKNGKLTPTTWSSTLDIVSSKLSTALKNHGPESILYIDYAGNTGLVANVFPRRLWNAIGATQTDHAICSVSGKTGIALHYGSAYGLFPEDLALRRLIVFWGFNAVVSAPHIWAIANRVRRAGQARIAVVDPVRTKTAEKADIWLRPVPGTDVALAYGIMSRLMSLGAVDMDFIGKHTNGYDSLKAEAEKWQPEYVSSITGINTDQLEHFANLYADCRPSATMIGIGLQKSDNGADQVRAASLIPALLGNPRGFFYSNSPAFLLDEDSLSGVSQTANPSIIVSQVALADRIRRGEFRFIYVNCMNPAMTLTNQLAFREGIARPDVFLAVHDTHHNETVELADIVLPAPSYLEKKDLVVSWVHPYVRISNPVMAPVGESRSEVRVMWSLARKMEISEPWVYDDPWAAVERSLEGALESGSFQDLESGALLKLKSLPRDHYATRSGKIEFYSTRAERNRLNPIPVQETIIAHKNSLAFLAGATSNYTSTQFQEVYGRIPSEVLVHPEDAETRGIEDGDIVIIENEMGRNRLVARVSDAVPRGVLWSPRQLADLDGLPQNMLTSSRPQTIGKGPRFNSTRVYLTAES